uniref:DUF223 domain-containing protein n=1 Tax=Brassica oleracea TaxID=3712 RepID=A0A3P6B655_BRAOL|nr:unnamed protein product [Brassica oleracea]
MQHVKGLTLKVREGFLRSYLENGFNQNTFITRSNHVNDELYLNLTDFQSVLSGTLDENFLIDVLGQVIDCGDVENIQCTGGKQRKKLEFTLSNIK